MSKKENRYVVTFEAYVYAENDYMARKKAHDIKRGIVGDHSRVIEIDECPFASFKNRSLDDISEPTLNNSNVWVESDELPF